MTPSRDKTATNQQGQAGPSSICSQFTEEEYQRVSTLGGLRGGGLPHTLEGCCTLQSLNQKLRNPLDLSHLVSQMGQLETQTIFDEVVGQSQKLTRALRRADRVGEQGRELLVLEQCAERSGHV
jgi:hypothetical protein